MVSDSPSTGGRRSRHGIYYPLAGKVSNPLNRPLIEDHLDIGVRCVNSLLPIGEGAEDGHFCRIGGWKSTLLG